MSLLWWLVFSCIGIFYVHCDTVDSKTAKKFQFSIVQQNLQTIIMSIEERLRNLDTIYSSRSDNGFEGSIEQFTRKLDNIESKLAYIETIVHLQLDKISENMSAQLLKEDINRDHIKRKLDVIHENVNNRLTYIEIKLDTIGQNAHDNNNFLRNKLQKLEDKVNSRISDVEDAISDSIVLLEEAKDGIALNWNHTNDKLSEVTEKTIIEYFSLLENKYSMGNKQIVDNIKIIESNIKSSMNKSYEIIIDVEENFNEFSNKMSEMDDTIYDKIEDIEKNTVDLAKIINMTRNEIQNGFRSTMVQIGKYDKSKIMEDSSEILNEMDKKIENNFENVLLAQNIFLQTCHRLQMDESQMENKIGDLFQKLLDTLDAKMIVETDDINKVLKNLISTKGKSIIKTVDIQHSNELLKSVDQIYKQLLLMEDGIIKTMEISQNNLDNQINLTGNVEDIRKLLQSNLESNKLILQTFLKNNKTATANIDRAIDCIINGINCTQDILQSNQNVNDTVIFDENNDDNNKQKVIYDLDIRTMMNADEDNASVLSEENRESLVNTRDGFEHDFIDESNIEELPDP